MNAHGGSSIGAIVGGVVGGIAGGQRLVFLSEDPALPFPAPGSPDDPVSGTPGGLAMEVFSGGDDSVAVFAVPRSGAAPARPPRRQVGGRVWKAVAVEAVGHDRELEADVFEELDTDAVLARRPEWVLVDELAHTNVPGTRHEKRWQSVEELLDAGINVISTVNVQNQ